MRRSAWRGWLVRGVLISAALGSNTDVKAEPLPGAEARPGYPVSVAARPLVMPAGVYELSGEAGTRWSNWELVDAPDNFALDGLSGRAGLGPVELDAALEFPLTATTCNPDQTLQGATLGALVPVGATDRAVYLGGAWRCPGSNTTSLGFQGGYALRHLVGPAIAAEAHGGLSYTRYESWAPSSTTVSDVVSVEVRVAAQVQLLPRWAAELRFDLTAPITDTSDTVFNRSFRYSPISELSARWLFTTTHVDAFIGIQFAPSSEGGLHRAVVGVTGRLP